MDENHQLKLAVTSKEIPYECKNACCQKNRKIIWMLCTDLSDRSHSRHIIDAALALTRFGYKVTIITCDHISELYQEDLSEVRILKVGEWIPRNIYTRLRTTLYVMRSLYIAFWATFFSNAKIHPYILFCETSYLVLPLLKMLTKYKLMYFQYNFDMLKLTLPSHGASFQQGWLLKQCLMNADEILVPNKTVHDIFINTIKNSKILPVICPPRINISFEPKHNSTEIRQLFKEIYDDSIIFLVLGEFEKSSNFHIVIQAFRMLMKYVDTSLQEKLILVISGHCSKRRKECQKYFTSIRKYAYMLGLRGQILFLRTLKADLRKSLIDSSMVLLQPAANEVFSKYVLEAMALGKPVIAADTGFASEILEDSLTGFLVEPTSENFATAMSEVLLNTGRSRYVGNLAKQEFDNIYSLDAFGSRLNQLIQNHYRKQLLKSISF